MKDLPVLQKRSPRNLDATTQTQLNKETASDGTQEAIDPGSVERSGSAVLENGRTESDTLRVRDEESLGKPSADDLTKEKAGEAEDKAKDKHKWSTFRRRFGFTPLKEKEDGSSKQREASRTRNHHRRASGGHGPHFLATPAPSIRAGSRTASHPDIGSLCQQWADSKPSERPMTYIPASQPDTKQ